MYAHQPKHHNDEQPRAISTFEDAICQHHRDKFAEKVSTSVIHLRVRVCVKECNCRTLHESRRYAARSHAQERKNALLKQRQHTQYYLHPFVGVFLGNLGVGNKATTQPPVRIHVCRKHHQRNLIGECVQRGMSRLRRYT